MIELKINNCHNKTKKLKRIGNLFQKKITKTNLMKQQRSKMQYHKSTSSILNNLKCPILILWRIYSFRDKEYFEIAFVTCFYQVKEI